MAKSKRSKHMRAMRKILREKLAKKDEVKRLASLKQDNLIPSTVPIPERTANDEEMQVGGSGTSEFNSRTLKNKDGQYPSWLSGRQRKHLQAKQAVQKRNEKQKKMKKNAGKVTKRKKTQTKNKAEAIYLSSTIFRQIFRRLTSAGGSGDTGIADKVQQLITGHKVIVFSKTTCPYCIKAKQILSKYKLKDYKVIELDEIDHGNEYQNVLGKLTNARSVPRVFIAGECIGGGDDTERLDQNGDLEKRLKKVNAIEK
ncbi:unnamed protein product [Adineta ricciae]|uniref:Glutaredoxin-2, mitochondrial n=1 Tax=Adineta ricciae TaxID=249248 RepID=A0A816C154_ADIRI|nr:unnamed protein product [Adineta ricciae]